LKPFKRGGFMGDIDTGEALEAVAPISGAAKANGKPRKPQGVNYKPSTKEKREALTRVLPIIKAERAKRVNRRIGGKSSYDRSVLDRVFARMAEGQSAQEAQQAEGLAASTFQDWLEYGGGDGAEALSARQAYARAREHLADASFSMALDVPKQLYALALAPLAKPEAGKDDKPAPEAMPVDSAMVQAAKLLTDSLRWYAERLAPNRYADKSKAEAAVVNVTNNSLTISGRDLDADQRAQLRALLTAASNQPLIEG
jgi:hypothetical protein